MSITCRCYGAISPDPLDSQTHSAVFVPELCECRQAKLTDTRRSVDGSHVGFRFQRRIKILPGLAINISKSGVGFSAGGRGFHAGIDAKGRRYASASLPGTGISWREYQKAKPHHELPPHEASRIAGDHQLSPHGQSSRVAKNVALATIIVVMLEIRVAI